MTSRISFLKSKVGSDDIVFFKTLKGVHCHGSLIRRLRRLSQIKNYGFVIKELYLFLRIF